MSSDGADVWQAYAMDGAEALRAIEESLLQLEGDPADPAEVNRLYRGLHTLKGNSGFLRLGSIEKLAHRSEDLIGLVRDAAVPLDAEIVEMMLQVVDRLRELVELAGQRHSDADESEVAELVGRVSALHEARQGGGPPAAPAAGAAASPVAASDVLLSDTPSASPPVVQLDPSLDPEYLEIFLELGRSALATIGQAALDAQLGEASAAARLRDAAEDLSLAADRMGFVHVVGAVTALLGAGAQGSAGLAGSSDHEFVLCSALADVEDHYRRIAPTPKDFGVRGLFQRSCANAVFADVAHLNALVEEPRGIAEGEVVALFRRMRAACDYYGFTHASVRASTSPTAWRGRWPPERHSTRHWRSGRRPSPSVWAARSMRSMPAPR